ncbi:macro domain-containing protein [Paenibacillus sp. NRS-1775]|uniref:macro domain-containing protein n=1 Tax=unclassified Paenibacillus TaxID=185978 RepID=UPI003D2A253D
MIKIVEGNLLDATEDIIGHQVNCKGVMGSGVAKQLNEKYSNLFYEYKGYLSIDKSSTLGSCQFVRVGNSNKIVANIFGQDGYGYGKQFTDLKALISGLVELKEFAVTNKCSVVLPYKIGSDRGGANWNEVYKIIENVFSDYEVILYRWEP